MYLLPLTLTCIAITYLPKTGGPIALECVIDDAAGERVISPGQLIIKVGAQTTAAVARDVLASYVRNAQEGLLSSGKGAFPPPEKSKEEPISSLKGQTFTARSTAQ